MEAPKKIIQAALKFLLPKQDLVGKKVLITAGGTQENLDPVRFIGNRSSGKMGYALAKVARSRGAKVTLISANVQENPPLDINPVYVQTADEMLKAVRANFKACDVLVMAAAVADWRPAAVRESKIKKQTKKPVNSKMKTLKLELVPTADILGNLQDLRSNQIMVGFALETDNLIKNAKAKLKNKNLDLIVANNEKAFGSDQNRVILIDKKGKTSKLPLQSKEKVAAAIFDHIALTAKSV
jgi:phosphopantothenoylcysteine decarboxylase/phosphopantothenate--cysteine ligase